MPSFSHHPSALVVPEEPLIAPGYPERFRVRLAGRVEQVWLPALQDKPMYRAELVVAKSSPLALIGMPIVEPPGEDFEEESEDPEKQHHLNTASLATVTSQLEIVDVAFPSYPPFNYGDRVILKWQGQQMVPGVLAGALLRCSGVVSIRANQPIIYNPRYEIVPQFFVEKG